MPTPVGHALGGLAVILATENREPRHDSTLTLACVCAALLPDLDFVIGPFAGRSYHHYFTHSLGFAALFLLLATLLSRIGGRQLPIRDGAVVAAAYLSHIVLDLLAIDSSPPFGVELFWPISAAFYISPFTVFDDIWRGSLAILFGSHNRVSVAREVLLLAPASALLWWRGRQRR